MFFLVEDSDGIFGCLVTKSSCHCEFGDGIFQNIHLGGVKENGEVDSDVIRRWHPNSGVATSKQVALGKVASHVESLEMAGKLCFQPLTK